MSDVNFWFVHQIQAQPFKGSGRHGETWDAAQPVDCWVEEGAHQVVDAAGRTVVAAAAVYAPPSARAPLAVNSKVTLASGLAGRVVAVEVHDSGSLDLGLDHIVAHVGG